MGLAKTQDLVFTEFKGVDYRSNPLSVDTEHYSGDCRNCVGHGQELWKRPGMKRWGAAFTALVTDMVGWRPASGLALHEAVFLSLTYAGQANHFLPLSYLDYCTTYIGTIPPMTGPTAWTQVTGAAVGGGYASELEPCDTLLWRTSAMAGFGGGSARVIKNNNGVYTESSPTYSPVGLYGSSTWHKRTLWHFRNASSYAVPATFEWSDIDVPDSLYPTANIDKLDPKGSVSGLRGMVSMGEHAYIGGVDRTYLLTGATTQDFKIQQLPSEEGMVGKRSWVRVNGMAVGFTCKRRVSDRPDIDVMAYEVHDISAWDGATPKPIGEAIRPIIDGLNPIGYGFLEYTRACGWGAEHYAMFLANAYQWSVTGGNSTMFVLDTLPGGGGFWFWEVGQQSPYHISTIAEIGGIPLLASTSGYLVTPDWDTSNDEQIGYDAYWSWKNPEPHNKVSIEKVFVVGNQASGNQWSLRISVNGQNWYNYSRPFTPSPNGTVIPLEGCVKAANDVKVGIFFGSTSTRAHLDRAVISVKGMDRIGEVNVQYGTGSGD